MSIVFEATDPRGRRVICTDEIWHKNILVKRSWMEGWEEEVRQAIEDPSLQIFEDVDNKNRHVYYRRLTHRTPRYIRVVVEFQREDFGRVITAHPTDSGKSGEKPIWPE